MGLFDFFRKKADSVTNESPSTSNNEQLIDDVTFIRAIKHITATPWHQYDILLAVRGYGWDMMLDWADYMGNMDLENISQVTVSSMGMAEKDFTSSYHQSNNKCKQTPELQTEMGMLSVAGLSRTLKTPMKIVWINQTNTLRLFTLLDNEIMIKKYVETAVRRTFGTPDAMKLAQPIPEGQ